MIEHPDQLRLAREAAGLSIADAAQRLRLAARHLSALEAGDWSALPGAAFARASLRSYARLLGVPVDALLAQMPQSLDPNLLRPATRLETRIPRGSSGIGFGAGRKRRLMPLLVVAGILLLVLAGLFVFQPDWWQSLRSSVQARQGAASQPEASPVALAVPSEPSSAPGGADARPAGVPGASAAEAAASAPVAGASPSPAQAVVSGPTAQAPRAQILSIVASRDSWVEIRDEADRVLHMGVVRPSEPLRLEVRGPITYTIGNAVDIRLELSGQWVDLSAQIRPGTSIAKGSLP